MAFSVPYIDILGNFRLLNYSQFLTIRTPMNPNPYIWSVLIKKNVYALFYKEKSGSDLGNKEISDFVNNIFDKNLNFSSMIIFLI